ncbi:MAG: hypothetical protein IJ877_04145 [Candidatus Gastranaerophilales bacterium]|nr:hypothetical protein [Candidatus Gastranaerophilales bacterium]
MLSVSKVINSNKISFCRNISKRQNFYQDIPAIRFLDRDTFLRSENVPLISALTFDRVKRLVMDSILSSEPKESVAFVMDDEIIDFELGDEYEVEISDDMEEVLNDSANQIIVIHSHPSILKDKSAHPISYADFEHLYSYEGEKSIYAINALGEYSMLQKKDKKMPSVLKVCEYAKKHEQMIVQILKGKDRKIMQEYLDLINNETSQYSKEETERIEAEFEKLRKKEYVAKLQRNALHNFWLQNADKLGVLYHTNYSCFS